MRPALIALAAVTAVSVLSACGSSGPTAPPTTPPGANSGAHTTPATVPTSGGAQPTGIGTSATETATPGAPSEPGGERASHDTLRAAGLLDSGGHVLATKITATTPARIAAAVCGYVFGTPAQIGAKAKTGTVAMDEGTLTSVPGALACVYSAKGGPPGTFVIGVGTASGLEKAAHDGRGLVGVPLATGYEAILGYSPLYKGAVITKSAAQAWLRSSAQRVVTTGLK